MNRLFIYASRWGLPVLLGATALAFCAAVWRTYQSDGSLVHALSTTVFQLLDAHDDGPRDFQSATYVFFQLAIGWALVKVYITAVGLKWDTLRARRMTGHVVLVARRGASGDPGTSRETGALAVELALSLVNSGQRVALVIDRLDDTERESLWGAGIAVLDDIRRDDELLKRARVDRASRFLALRGSLLENIGLCLLALHLNSSSKFLCTCQIPELADRRKLDLEHYFDEDTARVRVFNESEFVARELLRRFPPDSMLATTFAELVHVLLVGVGSIGQSLLVHLAHIGHYANGRKPHVTIIDSAANEMWTRLRNSYPTISDLLNVCLIESDVDKLSQVELSNVEAASTCVCIAYVCMLDEAVTVGAINVIASWQEHRRGDARMGQEVRPFPIVVLDPPGGKILREQNSLWLDKKNVRAFSLTGQATRRVTKGYADSLLEHTSDERARALHDLYCRKHPSPLNKSWTKLPEDAREANRYAVEHFSVKMRAAKLDEVALELSNSYDLAKDTSSMTLLARMEHNRWCAYQRMHGFTYNAVRDRKKKHDDDLVPWEELKRKYVVTLPRESLVALGAFSSVSSTEACGGKETLDTAARIVRQSIEANGAVVHVDFAKVPEDQPTAIALFVPCNDRLLTVEAVENLELALGDRKFRLGDYAQITAEEPTQKDFDAVTDMLDILRSEGRSVRPLVMHRTS